MVDYGVAGDMNTPDPDPGEEYQHVNTQLFGIVDPVANRACRSRRWSRRSTRRCPGQRPTMDGFVTDYISAFIAEMGRQPTHDEYAQIMTGYTPEQMPVFSTLARGFAVFDHWFCEVPSQTFTNRSFFHAATASGYVVNLSPPESFPVHNTAETIFDRLEANGLTWRVYCDPPAHVSFTALIYGPRQGPLRFECLHHRPVLRRRRQRRLGDVLVHRAVPHPRPQRHAPAREHDGPQLRRRLAVLAAGR